MSYPAPILSIIFDDGGSSEYSVLAWGEEGTLEELPWQQIVQLDPYVNADSQSIAALGNVARTIRVTRRTKYATAGAMLEAMLTADATLPIAKVDTLDVRILDTTESPSETEANRTLKHYRATAATIGSLSQRPVFEELAVISTYVIHFNALAIVT
jgi:hypothetical protein